MSVDGSRPEPARGVIPARHVTPAGPPGAFTGAEAAGMPAPAGAPAPGGRRRTVDRASAGTIVAQLPWALLSLLLVIGLGTVPGALAGDDTVGLVGGIALPVVWIACGVLMLRPAFERVLARVAEGARPPTGAERSRLDAVWSDVTAAAGVDGGRFHLWVQKSDELNASAMSGRIVTVTRGALDTMPPRQLAAVLAHELGHHLGGHAVVALLGYWYGLPAQLVFRFVRLLGDLFSVLVGGAVALAAATTRLGVLGLLVFRPVVWLVKVCLFMVYAPFVAFVAIPLVLTQATTRAGELRADRLAAELGYGLALVEVFRTWEQHGDGARPTLRQRLLSTHPPMAVRIERLTAYLDAAPGRPA